VPAYLVSFATPSLGGFTTPGEFGMDNGGSNDGKLSVSGIYNCTFQITYNILGHAAIDRHHWSI